METLAQTAMAQSVRPTADYSLWIRQAFAILRMELRKNFWGKRSLLLYLLAAVPVALFAALALHSETAADIRRGAESDVIFAKYV